MSQDSDITSFTFGNLYAKIAFVLPCKGLFSRINLNII